MFSISRQAIVAGITALMVTSGASQATTYNVGPLPSDGSFLSFSGEITGTEVDVFNFVLPFDIPVAAIDTFFHVETGNGTLDTAIFLREGFDLGGTFLSFDDDITFPEQTFGICRDRYELCSSIGAGDDPLARNGGSVVDSLDAGNYSLGLDGSFDQLGTYEIRFYAQTVPVPAPSAALSLLGALGILISRRRRRIS